MIVEPESSSRFAQILSAVAQLLWPIFALLLGLRLLPELKLIFHKISESKNLKIKWGDKELSVQEAADNIQKVVGSLIDAEGPRTAAAASAAQSSASSPSALGGAQSVLPPQSQLADVARIAASNLRRVLWVDDKPNSIALELARLKDWDIRVDEARTTEEALEKFKPGKYSLVITDMYRWEGGVRVTEAGINLLKELRSMDANVPVIAYTASSSAKQYGSTFLKLGGMAVTSSAVELFDLLRRYLPRDEN
jgi:CheY-like chemotaxis protein